MFMLQRISLIQVLLKSIFEATEVNTPTTFIILNQELPSEAKITDDLKAATDFFDQGIAWLERLQTVGEAIINGDSTDTVFGTIKDVVNKRLTAKTMYFYLVDELTGKVVRGPGYPIKITTPSELVHKLLPVMQVGMRAMSLYNGVGGIARMFGVPLPSVPEHARKTAQLSVEVLKQARAVVIEPWPCGPLAASLRPQVSAPRRHRCISMSMCVCAGRRAR